MESLKSKVIKRNTSINHCPECVAFTPSYRGKRGGKRGQVSTFDITPSKNATEDDLNK
jgi:hypothetical protein